MSFFSKLGLDEKFVINGQPMEGAVIVDDSTGDDGCEYVQEVEPYKPSLLMQIGAVGVGFIIGTKIGDQINKI